MMAASPGNNEIRIAEGFTPQFQFGRNSWYNERR